MKLFYASTGTQLLNMLNYKANILKNEPADLFIDKAKRVPNDLINCVIASGLFQNVTFVTRYTDSYDERYRKKSMIKRVILYRIAFFNKYKYYSKQIENIAGDKKYNGIVTFGLWDDALFYVKYVCSTNKNATITLIEEGTLSRYNTLDTLLKNQYNWCNSKHEKRRFKAEWFANTGHRFLNDIRYFKTRTEAAYFYHSENTRIHEDGEIANYNLPCLTNENAVTKELQKLVDAIDVSEYEKRMIYIFSDYDVLETSQDHAEFLNVLKQILTQKLDQETIIKGHPALTLDTEYYCSLSSALFLDNRKYQLESLYSTLNLTQKILITRSSSAVIYAKYMFNKEPYVIFTYNLYPETQYPGLTKNEAELLSSDLKKAYSNPDKILIPKTFDELRDELQNISNKLKLITIN